MTMNLRGIRNLSTGIGAAYPDLLVVNVGDVVEVEWSVEYRGPAVNTNIWTAFGEGGATFNEHWNSNTPQSFGPDIDFAGYTFTTQVLIDSNIPGVFDLYAKIMGPGFSDVFAPGPDDFYNNILEVRGASEFQNFDVVSYIVTD